jgi:hypothetical protein
MFWTMGAAAIAWALTAPNTGGFAARGLSLGMLRMDDVWDWLELAAMTAGSTAVLYLIARLL